MWSIRRMARMNISILGISELKFRGIDEFNSDAHCTYFCRQESLRRNGVALIVNKRVWNAVLGCKLKNNRTNLVHFQSKPFHFTVIQVYAPITDAREAEVEWFYEEQQDLLKLTLYMDITRWSTLKSDWLYSLQPEMEKLYTVSKNMTGSWLWLISWTPYCQIQT